MGNVWETEISNAEPRQTALDMRALASLVIFSTSTPFPSLQPSKATALSSVGRQRQLCPLAASDVPTAALAAGSPGSSNMQKDVGALCITARNATCSGSDSTGLLFLPGEDCEKGEMALLSKMYADSRLLASLCSTERQVSQSLVQEK